MRRPLPAIASAWLGVRRLAFGDNIVDSGVSEGYALADGGTGSGVDTAEDVGCGVTDGVEAVDRAAVGGVDACLLVGS